MTTINSNINANSEAYNTGFERDALRHLATGAAAMTIPPLKTEWRSYASKWAKVCRWFAAGRVLFWLSGRDCVRQVVVLAVEDGGYLRIPARGDNVRRVRIQNIHLSRKRAIVEFSRAKEDRRAKNGKT